MTEIKIEFDPYRIVMPPIKEFIGEVIIVLPDIHVKLIDLSMGIIPDAPYLGGDAPVATFKMEIPEPGMSAGKMMKFLIDGQEQFKRLHQAVQDEFTKQGALLNGR